MAEVLLVRLRVPHVGPVVRVGGKHEGMSGGCGTLEGKLITDVKASGVKALLLEG